MKRIYPLIPAAFALLVVLVPVGAVAQVAMMNFSSSAVTWSPMVANDGMSLTVSGGGVWFQKSFKSGASPRFDTFDAEGNALPDGVYKWELSARPARTAGDRGEWKNTRTNIDGSFVRHGAAERIEPESGTFRIVNGSIVDPNGASEGGAVGGGIGGVGGGGGKGASGAGGPGTNDQVFADDLIVIGSACVGQDCSNGESFGFDTLRLKENNLRIKFLDTSTSASFPSNDWELTANDSSNGGQNKFSITDISGGRVPFTVEAGAPSHSLYVDDGGRIGLGTSTPVVEVHVKDGDSPTVRLEQDGTSGFTPQTWDLAGNETNFFIRDATNGSRLPLRIRPSAPSNSIFIDTDGDVGMRTSSPAAPLHVNLGSGTPGAGNSLLVLERSGGQNVALQLKESDTSGFWNLSYDVATDGSFNISKNGTGNVELKLDTAGNLTLNGNCADAVGGGGCTADYVFEPDYELMPLEELAAFVAERKHLPNVPSAEQTRAEGLNLTQMNGRLLEKIEELTLYTIDQQEELDRLAAEKASLEERLAALEEKVLN